MSVGGRSPKFDTGVLPLKWLGNCGTCLYSEPGYYLVNLRAIERLHQKTGRWQLKKMTIYSICLILGSSVQKCTFLKRHC